MEGRARRCVPACWVRRARRGLVVSGISFPFGQLSLWNTSVGSALLTQQRGDALKRVNQLPHKLEYTHVLLKQGEDDGEELFRFVPAQFAGRVAQHEQLPTRRDAPQLRPACVEEIVGVQTRVRRQNARDGSRDYGRRRGAQRWMREAGGAQEEPDPVVSLKS